MLCIPGSRGYCLAVVQDRVRNREVGPVANAERSVTLNHVSCGQAALLSYYCRGSINEKRRKGKVRERKKVKCLLSATFAKEPNRRTENDRAGQKLCSQTLPDR